MTNLTATPTVVGLLTAAELKATAQSIASLQLPSGMIEWFPGGHTDPWNHVEAAMAMATCGLTEEAEAAYRWLIQRQRPDGSWHNYYVMVDGVEQVEDPKLDTNCVAYLATGIWHHALRTGSLAFAAEAWPTVDRAITYVLGMQTERGEMVWAREVEATPWDYALVTGSSSIAHSLACASLLAEALGHDRPAWAAARKRLVEVIAEDPEAFEPKKRWAMDWYYPVLAGAITNDAAVARLQSDQWAKFVMEGRGVRCVSDQPWVTAAETAECVIALLAAGLETEAQDMFTWVQQLRADDGSYFTGMVFPDDGTPAVTYPDDERSSYTAAAIILAADALEGNSPTSDLFL